MGRQLRSEVALVYVIYHAANSICWVLRVPIYNNPSKNNQVSTEIKKVMSQYLPRSRGFKSELQLKFIFRQQWHAATACIAFFSMENFPEREWSKRKSPNDACSIWTVWVPPASQDTKEAISPRRSSTSPASRPRKRSRSGIQERYSPNCGTRTRIKPITSKVRSGSSSTERICMYNASSSENGKSRCTGRRPRMMSNRSVGRWWIDSTKRTTVAPTRCVDELAGSFVNKCFHHVCRWPRGHQ